MQTVAFKAGDTIIAKGDDGDTAFFIVTGSVEVLIGQGEKARTVGMLNRRSLWRNVPDRAGTAFSDRQGGDRRGMPRHLLWGVHRGDRGPPRARGGFMKRWSGGSAR